MATLMDLSDELLIVILQQLIADSGVDALYAVARVNTRLRALAADRQVLSHVQFTEEKLRQALRSRTHTARRASEVFLSREENYIHMDIEELYYVAAYNGYLGIIRQLLKYSTSLAMWTCGIEFAAMRGHVELVRLLLDRGAPSTGRALSYAVSGGHADVVQLLLERGATASHCMINTAVSKGRFDIDRLLRKYCQGQ